jgi:gluconate:H+ symporter, GntP family
MIEGPLLLGILLLAVAFIVIATARLRVHPFLVLLAAAFLTGLLVRMPLPDLVQAINGGFGAIMGTIGLVIVLGTMVGTILERAGARSRWRTSFSGGWAKVGRSWPCR